MVDDPHQFGLLEPGNGLTHFIVIHQDQALAVGPQQMEASQGADYLSVIVQYGIAAVAALEHGILHIIDEIIQLEGDQFIRLGNPADRRGLIQETRGAPGVIRRGDDAGVRGDAVELFRQIALAQDDAVDLESQGFFHHILLLSAEDDGFGADVVQIPAGIRQGKDHLAGNGIEHVLLLVDDRPFNGGEDVKDGGIVDDGGGNGPHVTFGNAAGRDHAKQCAVLIGHRQRAEGGVFLQDFPRVAHGDVFAQLRGTVKVDVPHLCPDRGEQHGRLKAEAFQKKTGFIVQEAQPGRNISALAQRIAKTGIRHGGDDGICVRVAMTADIGNLFHK